MLTAISEDLKGYQGTLRYLMLMKISYCSSYTQVMQCINVVRDTMFMLIVDTFLTSTGHWLFTFYNYCQEFAKFTI